MGACASCPQVQLITSAPPRVLHQYFTSEEAADAIANGYGSNTGGQSYAMDFAPVYVGYQNCQDLDVAELKATAVVLERGGERAMLCYFPAPCTLCRRHAPNMCRKLMKRERSRVCCPTLRISCVDTWPSPFLAASMGSSSNFTSIVSTHEQRNYVGGQCRCKVSMSKLRRTPFVRV
jgi:hypothetical protein